MHLTRIEDYGLIFLGEVAKQYKKGLVSVSQVSERYHISSVFLNKIVRELSQGGFLKSKEGKGGGYELSKDPRKINLKEVLEVLEGQLHINACTSGCDKVSLCGYQKVWKKLDKRFQEELEKITLKEFSDF